MITVCNIKGIEIKFHYSYMLLYVFLVSMTKDFWYYPAFKFFHFANMEYLIALLFVAMFTLNILIHELAHGLVNKREGLATDKIVFFLLGAGACTDDYFKNAGQEFRSSSAGLVASTFLMIGWYLSYFFLESIYDLKLFESGISTFVFFSGFLNMWLVIINIVPAFPTDGGRMFRSFLWSRNNDLVKSTQIAVYISWILSTVIMGYVFYNNIDGKIWFTITAVFVVFGSWLELQMVKTGKKESELFKEFSNRFKNGFSFQKSRKLIIY